MYEVDGEMFFETREEYVEYSAKRWRKTGAEFEQQRVALGISVDKAAQEIGLSASTLRRFEKGAPVMRANVVKCAYTLLLNYTRLQREQSGITIDIKISGAGGNIRVV